MQTEVRESGPFERVLTVQLAEDELEEAKDRAASKLSREIKIKGFRPGRAPRRIVEAHVGSDALRSEAIEEALPRLLGSALAEADLVPAVPPRLEDVRDTADGVEVEVKVTVWPRLQELPSYRGREVRIEVPEVTDEEVERRLERLREQFAELEPAQRKAEEGDYVSIDLSASYHGDPVEEASAQDFLYEVGSRSFVPGLDEQVEGAGAGDILRFNSTLPRGFGDLAGKEVTFQVLVKQVQRKKLPPLTDEWVSEVSEFESVEELREALRENLEEVKRDAIRSDFEERLVDDLLSEVDLVLPEELVGAEMERMLHRFVHQLESQGQSLEAYLAATRQDQQGFVEELRREAERSLKTRILLEAVATAEDLEVSTDEVEEVVSALARSAEEGEEAYRRRLTERGGEEFLAGDILRRKAAALLVEEAVPVDGQGNRIDLQDDEPDADTETEAGGGGAGESSADGREVREEG